MFINQLIKKVIHRSLLNNNNISFKIKNVFLLLFGKTIAIIYK